MKQIILSNDAIQKRAIWLEEGKLNDLIIDCESNYDIVGEIYNGRVKKVVPGMQAAFIDIGLEKYAYLERREIIAYQQSGIDQHISSLLQEGQRITVQVKKAAIGEKGPVVTELVEFSGKNVVYLPNGGYIAVSKRIANRVERQRLDNFGQSLKEDYEGMIFRTSANTVCKEQIRNEWVYLRNRASSLIEQSKQAKIPSRLARQKTIIERVVHEWPITECDEFIVDTIETKKLLIAQLEVYGYSLPVHVHQNHENLFSFYQVENVIQEALRPTVWLKNGANLRIDYTEAMTVIDVNSAKFTGKRSKENTVTAVNKEAAEEIARQLRIRNIGGMILVDFINMYQQKDKDKVLEVLKRETSKDRMTVHVIGFTQLGLVEMTRKKSRQSQHELLTKQCECCNETGRMLTDEALVAELEIALSDYMLHDEEAILIESRETFINYVQHRWLTYLEEKIRKRIVFLKSEQTEHFHIRRLGKLDELIKIQKDH
ncbi:Rne/Rng family ribonuclease [Bacillus solimangrovi]|uniref:S1 motif domain-containing protein n=1 Tax=Bacillus solimangrovi TaxID=1305675 RepID=A0A1E5LBV6_9BACI|nr:Rne/Rng family ribonuclease [Bacillus solimangrovi]OEH91469.1 hypothetical protein BFG57_04970 [Bacillus solimangrovi]